jgi:hypothetical protein
MKLNDWINIGKVANYLAYWANAKLTYTQAMAFTFNTVVGDVVLVCA